MFNGWKHLSIMATILVLIIRLYRLLPYKLRVKLYRPLEAFCRVLDGKSLPITRHFNGFSLALDLGEKTDRGIFIAKPYEKPVTDFVSETLTAGDTFIDVGANVGYYAALASSKGANVIALEPDAVSYAKLCKNVPGHCLRAAAGDENGTTTLHINPLNRGGNSILPFDSYKTGDTHFTRKQIESRFSELEQTVEMVRLDSLITTPVKLVKIDVEGFEYQVLKGMEDAFHLVENIVCEVTNYRDAIIDLLDFHGFRLVSGGRDLIFTKV